MNPIRRPRILTALVVAAACVRSARAQAQPQTTAWPVRIQTSAGIVSVYQPLPEKLEGDTLSARAAVSLTPNGATDPQFGAIWLTSHVAVDNNTRTMLVQDATVRQIKMADQSNDVQQAVSDAVSQQLPANRVIFSLDAVQQGLGITQQAREQAKEIQTAPPKIIVTQVPTTLVVLDGPPKLQPGQTAGVMRVVNTPFVMMLDMPSKQYYLRAGTNWMTAGDVTAQWVPTNNLPAGIATEANLVAPLQPGDTATAVSTQILVSEEPAELISSDGAPTYTPMPGIDLLYMSNTQSDVFIDVGSNTYYVLLSGRWYKAPNVNGPWSFVQANTLPDAFGRIPADSPKAHVLVSVAGTQQAKDARLEAYVPQTSAIARDAGNNLTVTYDGDPDFQPVQNCPVRYAANCADPVLLIDNGYYCCHGAVWYQAASPVGPWVVCTYVPPVVYTLPPSCPVYNCRYVYVYESTPDYVYCGYLPGYTGCYVYGPTVVYGTGYHYDGWYRHEYIPRPVTYGFAPRYEPHERTFAYASSERYDRTWIAPTPAHRDWFGPQGFVDYRRAADRRPVVDNHPTVINEHTTVVNNNVTVNRVNIYNRTENVKRNVTVNNRDTVVNRPTVINNRNEARPVEPRPGDHADHIPQVRPDEHQPAVDPRRETPARETPTRLQPRTDVPIHEQPHETPHTEVPARETPHETPREVPHTEAPARDVPAHETPHTPTPARDVPAHETPHAETPAREAPHAESPAHETPARDVPAREAPHAESPAREAPHAESPAHETPARDVPAREAPHAESPAHETPAHVAPSHEVPVHDAPHAESPAHDAPSRSTPVHVDPAAATPPHAAPPADAPVKVAPKAPGAADQPGPHARQPDKQ